jgi:hypothetical protein
MRNRRNRKLANYEQYLPQIRSMVPVQVVSGLQVYVDRQNSKLAFYVPSGRRIEVNGMNNMQDLTPKLNYIASLFNPINPSKNGPYSDGWFVDGVADWEQSPPILHQAIDNGLWYTYGFATANPNPVTQSPCDFYRSNGAEVIGHFNQQAGYLGQGAWSTGFYVDGVKSTTFNCACPLFMYDDNNCYTFVNGNPVLATCQIAPD